MNDQNIIKRVQNGEVDAYALLVEKYHRNLLAFIFRLVRDRRLTEDIGQEVFLKVYRALPRFDPERGTPFSAWLYIVARNQCISELRKRKRAATASVEHLAEIAADGETAEAILLRREELAALKDSLQQLPEPFRTTIRMSLNGATPEEIARSCEITQATVKTRLFRARQKLTLLLKGHFRGVGHERGL